jgi:tetratricopeptide (TPR) repeat protein
LPAGVFSILHYRQYLFVAGKPMKVFISILTILTANSAFGQASFDRLLDKAFDFYFNGKQFDSSLFYYQEINRRFPDTRPAYINKQIADCYLGLGDTANAKMFYLKCLSIDRYQDSLGFSQTGASASLSAIYYNRQQFKEALTYLDYTKTIYRPLRWLCQGMHGGYEGRLSFAYKKSLCYYGLSEKDSAINELAPLIFRPTEDVYLDSLEFEEMSRYFVNTVFEVLGVTRARNELQKAIKNLTYKPGYEDSYNMIMFSVDCFITFANTKIKLGSGGSYQVDKKGEIPEFFSKETLLKEFTDSPAYRYIMTDECQPTTLHWQY